MNEGKRIEGQMFVRGGIGWVVAVVLLLVAAAGVLVLGYGLNRWISITAGMGGTGVVGGGGTNVLVMPGATGAGAGGTWAFGIPPPNVATVLPADVPWPAGPDATFREHWEKQVPGVGTLHAWYMDPGSPQYWQLSSAISIPVANEPRYVIAVHVPRSTQPPDATKGQLWVCELVRTPGGDIVPSETTVALRASLDGDRLKFIWENGFPERLVQDLVDAANGTGPLTGAYPGPYTPLVDMSPYFPVPAEAPDEAPGESEEDPK